MNFNTLTVSFDDKEAYEETEKHLAENGIAIYECDKDDLWMEIDVSGFTVDDFKKYLSK